jgi:hypothetical protein
MKIQKARRFNKTDFPDAPDWMEEVFQVLNNFQERITTLVQGNQTFADNFRAEVAKIDLRHGETLPVKLNVLKKNPVFGFFGGSNYFEKPEFTWELADEPLTVNVNVEWKNPPDDEVRCNLLFVGE